MRRLLTLVFLLCLGIPAGISISGCTRNPAGNYCNGLGYGPKLTDVASIDLEPRTTSLSLAFGQTTQLAAPKATTCNGNAATVATYTYGTTNNQLLDVSPTGSLCGGTWNRRSGGGIPDFTICNPPSPLPSTKGLPYAEAFVSATGSGVASNQVAVYVHTATTAVNLVLESASNTSQVISGCLSQTQTAQLDSQVYYNNNGVQTLLCAPNSSAVANCSNTVGDLTYTASNTTVASIDQFGVITAALPGTTYITASVGTTASSAGYFSTCPPASINISLNGADSGTVTQGVTQTLQSTFVDTKGNTITGLTPDYQSTNPQEISVGSAGAVTANFAGQATIYAVCQPTTCNPSPINAVGVNQTGVSITSNPVTITTPGTISNFAWFSSPQSPAYPASSNIPGYSQGITLPGYAPSAGSRYFSSAAQVTGSTNSPVLMPYTPNSMVMDKTGTNLYFGSPNGLMIYAAATNSLTATATGVPGMVLAAAPDNSRVLVNDPLRQIFYIYTVSTGAVAATYSGVGTAAQWTPDAKTLYIVGTSYPSTSGGVATPTPTLFVYNANTGFTTYTLPSAPEDVSVTVPGYGAFSSGTTTSANGWCPTITASTGAINQAYPNIATVPDATSVLHATNDGAHMLGAALSGAGDLTLTDINLDYNLSLVNGACPVTAGTTTSTKISTSPVTATPQATVALPAGVAASAVEQVVPAQDSAVAYITYAATTASSGTATLPYYTLGTGGAAGPVKYVTLSTTSSGVPTAPVAGAFSLDDSEFFVSTSGDNLVHVITTSNFTDSSQISPQLTDTSGNAVPATRVVTKPRATT